MSERLSKKIIPLLQDKGIIFNNVTIKEMSAGFVHYVYCVQSGYKIFYLKIRGTRFKFDKNIAIKPADIALEIRALKFLQEVCPGFAPMVEYEGANFFLMEDIVKRTGIRVGDLLYKQQLTKKQAQIIGKNMCTFHKKVGVVDERIKEPIFSQQRYEKYLFWRFGIWHNKYLDQLILELAENGNKQIIYGDFNPGNLVLRGNRMIVYDLETLHWGDREFDVGFFLGHLLFSYLDKLDRVEKLFDYFNDAYMIKKNCNEGLLIKVVTATIYYRLKSQFNYPVTYKFNLRQLTKKIEQCLKLPVENFPAYWSELRKIF